MCISYIPYVVHWSMCQAGTGGLNIVRVGPKIMEMAENGQKCAHSLFGQMEHMSDLNGVCSRMGTKCYVSNIPFLRRPNPLDLGMAGSLCEPMISD